MAAREIVATGCPIHQAPFGPGEAVERRGPEGVHEMVELRRAPFSDLAFSIEVGPIGDGEMVAARWVARGNMGVASLMRRHRRGWPSSLAGST